MHVYVADAVSGCTTRHRRGLEAAKLLTGPFSLSALLLEGRGGQAAAWYTGYRAPRKRIHLQQAGIRACTALKHLRERQTVRLMQDKVLCPCGLKSL